ncbi:2-C-methyl-D-erythritol 4-phosphate cytidylyltransferase [Alcanivorax sp. DP30]|uniref:2-C-methyl-D-erythritol 4-phosphate cytidylyltransferase n=1 Tax=Alcanivorax sp. DP30 TaxID=2606217 RepID=UPI0013710DF5|nr:2-C-methyl-D-erythritol 4-phosphate cytidylyltransferase [Alcanivorax sp. DP30]
MNPVIRGPLFSVVPAAGVGQRMQAGIPKQYLTLAGKTLTEHTVQRLLSFAPIESVVVAVSADDPWWPTLPVASHRRVHAVTGGQSRAESVRNALAQVLMDGGEDAWVLVHDMARPLVRLSDIQSLLASTAEQGAILALPVVDTIKQAGGDSQIDDTLNRDIIWRALTPQLFPAAALYEALSGDLADVTDEASALERQGWRPKLVAGHSDNIKITVPEDLPLARFYLARQFEEQGDL